MEKNSSDPEQRLSAEVEKNRTSLDDSSFTNAKDLGTKIQGVKDQVRGNDNRNFDGGENDNETLVDNIISMALQSDDGEDDEEGEFLSASDGGESDDEIIQEWGDSLSDLTSNDYDRCTTGTMQSDTVAAKEDVSEAATAAVASVSDTDSHNGEHVSDAKDHGDNEQQPATKTGVKDGGKEGSGTDDDDDVAKLDVTKAAEKEKEEKSEEDEEMEELHKRQEIEDALTEEERQSRLADAVSVKVSGNNLFKEGQFTQAMEQYTEGLKLCPLKYVQQRSIMLSNRAACLMKEEQYEEAVQDCSKAIELQPTYIKAINRRANAYEKLEKLEEALKDHQKILELDRSQADSYHAAMRLENEIKERNEKLKNEMMGKLKDLGNMVLRPFGLSTNNFQLQEDPTSGSYSVQFVQNPPDNGH